MLNAAKKVYLASTIVVVGTDLLFAVSLAVGMFDFGYLKYVCYIIIAVMLHAISVLLGYKIRNEILRVLSGLYAGFGNIILLLALIFTFFIISPRDICHPGGGDVVMIFPPIIFLMPLITISCKLGEIGKSLLPSGVIIMCLMVLFNTKYMWCYPQILPEKRKNYYVDPRKF